MENSNYGGQPFTLLRQRLQGWVRNRVADFNKKFDSLPPIWKKALLILIGVGITLACVLTLVPAIRGKTSNTMQMEKITTPTDIHESQTRKNN